MTTAELPRCNHDMERNVLGVLLDEPHSQASILAKLQPKHFDHEPWREVCKAIVALSERGEPADYLLVRQHLIDIGKLGHGPGYAVDSLEYDQLTTNAVHPEHVDAHANTIIKLWGDRRIYECSARLAGATQGDRDDVPAIIKELEA